MKSLTSHPSQKLKTFCFFGFVLISLLKVSTALGSSPKSPLLDTVDLKISDYNKAWTKLDLKPESRINIALESPSQNTTFTLRIYNNHGKTLKGSIADWVSDYNSYGFTITNKKPLKLNDTTYGYKIVSNHNQTKKKFIQFMSVHKGKLATLTCQSNHNDNELRECNKFINSFTWKKGS